MTHNNAASLRLGSMFTLKSRQSDTQSDQLVELVCVQYQLFDESPVLGVRLVPPGLDAEFWVGAEKLSGETTSEALVGTAASRW